MDVRGKTIVVTGAGRGIGRSIAVHLAGKGANLALLDTNAADVKETQALCTQLGVVARSYVANAANEDSVVGALEQVGAEFRPPRWPGEQRRHRARCDAGEGQGRTGGRQDDTRAVAGGHRREPHRGIPVRARGGAAHDRAGQRRRDRERVEHLAGGQCRPDQLQRGQGRRRRDDGGVGQGAGALWHPRRRRGARLHPHPAGGGHAAPMRWRA